MEASRSTGSVVSPRAIEPPKNHMESSAAKKRILILGGGFAGAYTALHLEKQLASTPDVEIMLVSRENFVLFTPMLHEVAGADVAGKSTKLSRDTDRKS